MRGGLQFVAGDYKNALRSYEQYLATSKANFGNTHFPAWITWCRGQIDSEFVPSPDDTNRTSWFAAAAILAQRGMKKEACEMVRRGIQLPEGNTGRHPVPFFLDDYPTCQKLLQLQTAEAWAARQDYETLIRLHKIAAAVIAFQKQNDHFPRADSEGVSWRKQIAPFFQLPNDVDVVREIYALSADEKTTPFAFVILD